MTKLFLDKEPVLDLMGMHKWYTENSAWLYEQYAGMVIAMVNNEVVAVTKTEKEADQIARSLFPNIVPYFGCAGVNQRLSYPPICHALSWPTDSSPNMCGDVKRRKQRSND